MGVNCKRQIMLKMVAISINTQPDYVKCHISYDMNFAYDSVTVCMSSGVTAVAVLEPGQ